MKNTLYAVAAATSIAAMPAANAVDFDVQITNLSNAIYFTPFLGGMIADRFLGFRRSVFIGGLLMAAGHLLMTVESEWPFFFALALLIAGNGFFEVFDLLRILLNLVVAAGDGFAILVFLVLPSRNDPGGYDHQDK